MEYLNKLSGHVVGLIKEYMRDLVEQADQEDLANKRFGFTPPAYKPDHAIADLLAILDDRSESEGIQVGLPENLLPAMWNLCNEASEQIDDRVWLEGCLARHVFGKAKIREITYRVIIEIIESRCSEGQ